MVHKVKVTVLDCKVFPELQQRFCADPNSGPCPCYHAGDTFVFERREGVDSYWQMGLNTLVSTQHRPEETAGGPTRPHCSEAWDAISRYIYTGLQGGSIMKGWMNDDRVMVTCCNDGTRPVIFKIERIDILVLKVSGIENDSDRARVREALATLKGIAEVRIKAEQVEIDLAEPLDASTIAQALSKAGAYHIVGNL